MYLQRVLAIKSHLYFCVKIALKTIQSDHNHFYYNTFPVQAVLQGHYGGFPQP